MLIEETNLSKNTLKDEVAIVTGAGRGIGYEAARALLWLGANIAIAEINEKNGKNAAENLQKEFGSNRAFFVKTDIGNEKETEKFVKDVMNKYGKVDIILNNATVFPMGAIKDAQPEKWDLSYRVHLRGPVTLAKLLLPDMMKRNHGCFVCVSSSGAAPFMGAYEVFKTAQVELANTLAAELEGTKVYAFTIGPGIVRTPGFEEGGSEVAACMGKTLDDLLAMNKNFEISAEAAGVGFAAAIALAPKYHGQETSSIQVLREIGVVLGGENDIVINSQKEQKTKETIQSITIITKDKDGLYASIFKTYTEQSAGWKKRNLFERQWISRDFKKSTGMSIDEMSTALKVLGENLSNRTVTQGSIETLKLLKKYYEHQHEQLRGFEKDPKKLQENLAVIDTWTNDIKALLDAMT
jgi:NAD(P)-dependent dehydrogenase (short-subunit alcohol dehydrogenase family)